MTDPVSRGVKAVTGLPETLTTQLGRLLGSEVVSARAVCRGYTPARRWLVGLADGRSVFVKQAVDPSVVPRLRREHAMYAELTGPGVAQMLGYEDGAAPVLVLEDL